MSKSVIMTVKVSVVVGTQLDQHSAGEKLLESDTLSGFVPEQYPDELLDVFRMGFLLGLGS